MVPATEAESPVSCDALTLIEAPVTEMSPTFTFDALAVRSSEA